MKQLFAAAGLPQTPHVNLLRSEWKSDAKRCIKRIEKKLTYPVFVKPANLGSSVGISKVHDRSELAPAMDLAASFDRKLIIEQGVGGPGAKAPRTRSSRPRQRLPRGLRRRRDRPRRRVLRLQRQVPLRRLRPHHPRATLKV